jgi:hypothetical protein
MKRLRLLKVVVQPTFVLVDDESIEEMQGQPVLVSAQDWPIYSSVIFPEAFAELKAQVEGPTTAEDSEPLTS